MRKKVGLTVLFLAMLLTARSGQTQESNAYQVLARAYSSALETGDEKKINQAWEDLNRSAQALSFLRQSDPRLFQSFEYWRIKRELQELRRDRALSLPDERDRSLIRTRSLREQSNSERVRGNPNQERMSNRKRAIIGQNQNRRPNQDKVDDTPNQERLSNQERIRSRLRSGR